MMQLELLGAMTASMCLCLDHPGVGNPFLVQSHSPLALTYNDEAPLQSHAAAAAFALMNRDDGACDILIHLNDLQYRYVRRIIILCVLASDNRRAFEVADKAKAAAGALAAAASPGSALSGESRLALLEAATCWGNVSYTCRESSVHKEWASFLSQELVHQGEREREGSLPESAFCDAQQSQAVRFALGRLFCLHCIACRDAVPHPRCFALPPQLPLSPALVFSLQPQQALLHLNMIDLIASPVLHPLLSFAPAAGASALRSHCIPRRARWS